MVDYLQRRLNMPVVVYMVILHLGALAAPFCFTWSALLVFFFLWWLTGCLGITLGYHRLLTHGAFQTFPWVQRTLAVLGSLASQGPPIQWVSDHRQHHQFTDREGDPHSPRDGFWWSHIIWGMIWHSEGENYIKAQKYVPDLASDPFLRALNRLFLPLNIASGVLLFALGGWPWLVWGLFLRLVVTLHVTWAINSVCHVYGYKNYDIKDDSRNNWWLALLSFGESWHNNHHAHPTAANHGHHPWEPDHTYWLICKMGDLGLAWDVKIDLSPNTELDPAKWAKPW